MDLNCASGPAATLLSRSPYLTIYEKQQKLSKYWTKNITSKLLEFVGTQILTHSLSRIILTISEHIQKGHFFQTFLNYLILMDGWDQSSLNTNAFFKKIWQLGLEWDTLLPNEITEEWLSSRDSLKQLENLQIPRCVLPDKKFENFQLHLFTDASEKAYAATVYSRFQSSDGSISVQLLVAKTRVAPVKVVSLPRLELCGAQLGTRLIKTVIESLQSLTTTIDSVHAWTDSTIVLQWLNQFPRTWATFVANRVSEIQDFLPRNNWNHVPSQNNPADLSSRGADVRDLLQSKLW